MRKGGKRNHKFRPIATLEKSINTGMSKVGDPVIEEMMFDQIIASGIITVRLPIFFLNLFEKAPFSLSFFLGKCFTNIRN
jgi:hypothetical protein